MNIQTSLDDLTNKVARTVHVLREWRALEYTGHFIDVDEDMKTRIHEVLIRTQEILDEWGYRDVP
jgi:hypothetical protein